LDFIGILLVFGFHWGFIGFIEILFAFYWYFIGVWISLGFDWDCIGILWDLIGILLGLYWDFI
jgi:hypothetical protein